VRDCDPRDAEIGWRAVPGATGYNVRWGIRPDRLALAYQLFADRSGAPRARLILRVLNTGQDYFVAVEAFNESGVSELSHVRKLEASCGR